MTTAQIVADAEKAFGHLGGGPVDWLALRVQQMARFADERNAALSATGRQAQQIADLERRLAEAAGA